MKTTDYYSSNVLVRRPYLKQEWIRRTLEKPITRTTQSNGRIRHWAYIAEAEKYLRVVTEADGETVHNAFFDRGFKPPN